MEGARREGSRPGSQPALSRRRRRRPAGRLAAFAALACLAAAAGGCGESAGAGAIEARNPAAAFAPVVHFHPREPYRPMGARWFLSRSMLLFAEDDGCADREVSVGRLLKAQQNEVTDWTFITGLGEGPGYWRYAYTASCDDYRPGQRHYANGLTRPLDESPGRSPGLRVGEGFYLDLMDWGRGGPKPRDEAGQAVVGDAFAWFERRRHEVDGEPGLLLSYWMLFGMSEPRDPRDRAVAALTHEGDWERVDVLLRGEGGEWEPLAVRLTGPDGRPREIAWERLRLTAAEGGPAAAPTHPVLFAARGGHSLYARPGAHERDVDLGDGRVVRVRDVAVASCMECPRWETWRRLSPAGDRAWYGFGGAWGEVGPTDQRTGPLGPHGAWAVDGYRPDRAQAEEG